MNFSIEKEQAIKRIAIQATRGCLLAGALCVTAGAIAQTLNAKPLRAIVPFPPGGSVDALTRVMGAQISASTGQPVVVENRPGGATFVGMSACAKGPADGHTVCISTPDSVVYAPFLYNAIPFDVEKDFAAVTQLVVSSSAIYVRANSPYNSFKELISAAKAKPGAINYGTWGPGSVPDIVARYAQGQLGINMTLIPYKGAQPGLMATLAGEIDVTYFGIGPLLPQLRAGKVRLLAVTGSKRSPYVPDVPSLGEFNADSGMLSYFGLWTAAQTPRPMVDALHAEFVKALRTPAVTKVMGDLTVEPVGNSPAEFEKFFLADRANAGKLLKGLGVKPQDVPN